MAISIKYKHDSFLGAVSVTPSDTINLTDPVSSLYIGVTGNIKVDMASGETVTFLSVPVGVLNIAVKKVYATGTTATSIIGLK